MTNDTKAPAAPKAVKEPKVVVSKIEKNGVVRPSAGSLTEKPWVVADNLMATNGKAPSRKEVIEASVAEGVNEATASTQYGRWRVFNGVKAAPIEKKFKAKAPKAPKAPEAPAAVEPAETEAEAEEIGEVDETSVISDDAFDDGNNDGSDSENDE